MDSTPLIRLVALLIVPTAFSFLPATNTVLSDPQTHHERRLALVIGNSNYRVGGPLRNPINDATDIGATLRELGFEVMQFDDISQRRMKEAIREFGKKLRNGDVGLFYFAGHGIQISGRNYLIPIDANIEKEGDVEFEAVDAGTIVKEMGNGGSPLNIVILDACRNNPFRGSFRSNSRGLAVMGAAGGGMVIAYSTEPDSVASDGSGRNGLYTEELLKYMKQPGLRIDDLFMKVRTAVAERTRGKQIPWESVSLYKVFQFNPATTAAKPPAASEDRTENIVLNKAGESPAGEQEHVEPQFYSETINGVAVEMVRLPAGGFLMGSPTGEGDEDEHPQHEVMLPSFYMARYEVTQLQWRAVMQLPKDKIDLNANPSYFKGDNLPVEQVSWEEAVEFCERLSKKTGRLYRLPTEAEWEYGCRAGTELRRWLFKDGKALQPYAGDLKAVAWYSDNSAGTTHAVGSKRPNRFGLCDLYGNVWEWCADWYSERFYSISPKVDPRGANSGSNRIRRGGCWRDLAPFLWSAHRDFKNPGYRGKNLGFRLVRTYS